MARGRKAQPAAVKEAKGNPGKRPIPPTEAVVIKSFCPRNWKYFFLPVTGLTTRWH